MSKPKTIELSDLNNVTGGVVGAERKPIIPPHGFPQHSAGWWEIRRAQQAGIK